MANREHPETPLSAQDDDPVREREGGDRNPDRSNDAGIGSDDDEDFDDDDEVDEEEEDEEK